MSIIKFDKNINTKVLIQKDLRWDNFSFDDGKVFFKGEKDFVKNIFNKFKKNKYDLQKIKKLLYRFNKCSSAIFFNNKYYVCLLTFVEAIQFFQEV